MRGTMLLHTLLVLALAPMLRAEVVTPLREGWKLRSACKLQATGEEISQGGFSSDAWLKATVPSTVIAAQAAAGVFPDPYFGMNLRQIPGTTYPLGTIFAREPMPQDSPYRCGWWYRTEFAMPAGAHVGQRQWLRFGGINYRGEVWVNGRRIADTRQIAGAYRTYDLDATNALLPGSRNAVAVQVFAPTEKDLGINWVDWNPCPADKDMGLWGAVDLVTTGSVTVRSPLAVTHFADNSLATAELTVYAELRNAGDQPARGVAEMEAAGIKLHQKVELAAHEDKTIAFTPAEFPQLKIRNPKPWWPRQMGEPHLERLAVRFREDGPTAARSETVDEQNVEFGFREITSELTVNGSRLFRVNGKPILIRGAGWSQDMLLRADEKRLKDQFRLVEDMNLNTIRLEGKLEAEEFFRIADRDGILVMLGWCCCDHWERWKDWTAEDLEIATASLRSQMLRLRHHASLLAWLNGSDNAPPADVERAYLNVEAQTHWPNPVLSAASSQITAGGGLNGVKMTGPYDYVAPSYWYLDKQNGGAYGFNTETSPGPAIPSLASRRRFLTDPEAWPPTAEWSYHLGSGKFATLKVLDEAMQAVYAKPQSAADYERISQTMEYDSERAMFEAYSRNKYDSTGVIQWMLNNAWPSMIWHLYDYYLDAGGGYFGVKKACEPVHIQYSYDDRTIVVVNSTYERVTGLRASVEVHNAAWKQLYADEKTADAGAYSAQMIFTLPESLYAGAERTFFIDLTLKDAAGTAISRNFYWVPGTLTAFNWAKTDYTHTPALRHEDLTALASLPKSQLVARATLLRTARGREVLLELRNPGAAPAFQISAALRTGTGDLIAPVLWSDNWIELTPGEKREITALLPEAGADAPVVEINSWNAGSQRITPAAEAQSGR